MLGSSFTVFVGVRGGFVGVRRGFVPVEVMWISLRLKRRFASCTRDCLGLSHDQVLCWKVAVFWERRNEGEGDLLVAESLREDFLTNEIIVQDFEASRMLSYLASYHRVRPDLRKKENQADFPWIRGCLYDQKVLQHRSEEGIFKEELHVDLIDKMSLIHCTEA